MSKVTLTTGHLFLDDWNVMSVPENIIAELVRLASGDAVVPSRVIYAKDGIEVSVNTIYDTAVVEVREKGIVVLHHPLKRINWEKVLYIRRGLNDLHMKAMSINQSEVDW